jgi:hypothetical protein
MIMAKNTQTIELRLVVSYSTEDGKAINLGAVSGKVSEMIFNALENQRQEGTISPAGLSCDYFDLDIVKVNESVST